MNEESISEHNRERIRNNINNKHQANKEPISRAVGLPIGQQRGETAKEHPAVGLPFGQQLGADCGPALWQQSDKKGKEITQNNKSKKQRNKESQKEKQAKQQDKANKVYTKRKTRDKTMQDGKNKEEHIKKETLNPDLKTLAPSTWVSGRAAGNQRTPRQGAQGADGKVKSAKTGSVKQKRNYNRGLRSKKSKEQRREKRRTNKEEGRSVMKWAKSLAPKARGAIAPKAQELRTIGDELICKKQEAHINNKKQARREKRKWLKEKTKEIKQDLKSGKINWENKIKVKYKNTMKMASLNCRGTARINTRMEIMEWMTKEQIDIMLLQETHQGKNTMEKKDKFTWYFSGGDENREFHGVGIVIKNKIRPHRTKNIPVNSRIMEMTVDAAKPITIINAYAPTAEKESEEKEKFYEEIKRAIDRNKHNVVIAAGDWNARLVKTRDGENDIMGKHHIEEGDPNRERPENQEENREHLIQLCKMTNMRIRNTDFEKPNYKKVTFKKVGETEGGPWDDTKYAEIDHVLIKEKSKNMITDVESDIKANIDTDHYPIKWNFTQKLKKRQKEEQRYKYAMETEEDKEKYNEQLKEELSIQKKDLEGITKAILKATRRTWTKQENRKNTNWISQQAKEILTSRQKAKEEHDDEQFKEITKELKKRLRHDKRTYIRNTINRDLDVRDKWLGIRNMKKRIPTTTIPQEGYEGKLGQRRQASRSGSRILGKSAMGKTTNKK